MPTLLTFLWILLCASAAGGQQVEFHHQAASRLKVKVVKVVDAIDGFPSALMTVELSNPTDYWAEPLEFLVPSKKRKDLKAHIIPRVEAPYYGRAGRAIAPGEKLRYVLSLPDEPKRIGKSKVKVTQASFFSGDPVAEAPIEIGEIDSVTEGANLVGEKIRFSRVMLRNTSDFTIDATLQAKFSYPKSGTALVRFRLNPKEQRRFTIQGPQISFSEWSDLRGSDVKSLELIDWSALRSTGPDPGVEILRAAYQARAAWPEKDFAYEAQYKVEIEQYDWNTRKRVKIVETGRCSSKGRFAQFEPDQGVVLDTAGQGQILLGHANRNFAQPDFEAWLEGGTVQLHTRQGQSAVVAVTYGWENAIRNRYYWIEDNQIVRQARYPFAGTSLVFENERNGSDLVVAQETAQDIRLGPTPYDHEYQFRYQRVDGQLIPVEMHQENRFNPEENNLVVHLKLSKIKLLGEPTERVADTAPTGELADRVRAAWDRGYRYPATAIRVRGSFVMSNGGNDLIWRGHKEVRGTFDMQGLRGSDWERCDVVLQGEYSEATDLALQETVRDRFGMYMGRDLSSWPSYEKQFAGASFEKKGSKILVKGSLITQLEIRKGRLEAYWMGDKRKLTWKQSNGFELLVRAQHGAESIRYQRREINGVWLPVKILMEDVFADWGPEQVILDDVQIENP
jgi:hypothetical protein